MNAHDAALRIVKDSGMPESRVALAMGYSKRALSNLVYHNGTPRADNLARIADVCGYDLLLRNRQDGSEILIDPPEKPEK